MDGTMNAAQPVHTPSKKKEGKIFCPGCQEVKKKVSHRVVARVKDESGTTTFTIFNKEAELLIGVPLEKIFSELAPINTMEGTIKDIPTPIKNMMGKVCVFQIKVTEYNITRGCEEYTVTQVSECSSPVASKTIGEEGSHKDKRMKTA
ncbi:hypothetical protein ACET3Z_000757 [Daucus carota]